MSLSQSEASLLECLERLGGRADAATLASKLGLPESSIFPLSSLLSAKGYVTLTEDVAERFRLTEEGERCAEEGLPEVRVMRILESRGGSAPLADVTAALSPDEVSAALGWAGRPAPSRSRGGVPNMSWSSRLPSRPNSTSPSGE